MDLSSDIGLVLVAVVSFAVRIASLTDHGVVDSVAAPWLQKEIQGRKETRKIRQAIKLPR